MIEVRDNDNNEVIIVHNNSKFNGVNNDKNKNLDNNKKEKARFPIEGQMKVKMEKSGGKQNNFGSMKEREWKIFRSDKFSAR